MNPTDALSAAKQVMAQAQSQSPIPQGQGMPSAQMAPQAQQTQPQAPQGQAQAKLPVPPPHVANYLAQMAQAMHPQVLGTLIWRALQQHGVSIQNNTPNINGVGANTGVSVGNNNIGAYTEPGLASVGGKIGPVGGTVGVQNGQPFGSANINGNQIGSFGPQGN